MTMRRSARSISRLPMVWVLGVAAVAVRAQTTNSSNSNNITNETVYVNCDLDVYYAELLLQQQSAWTRAQVQALIVETHRNVLPYKGGSKDEETIAFALIDLDPGLDSTVDDPTVRMYDRDLDFAASKQTPEGWKRADFWPLSRGANLTTDASTDVHGKRPADWEVDSVLQDLFWGVCGTVESAVNCVTPAVANQTAATTAQDGKVKTPHEGVRGAVARSVLYTAVRYELELGLALTDCPPFATTEYGYLSELLNWHAQYPPDQREQDRNDRACSRWQGNRNPFVDFPDLVSTFFGEPDVIQEGSFSYSQCVAASIETMSPTATPNDCSALQAGDVAILIFNSDPVDQIALFPLVDISPSVGSLFITNRAWNGTDFCNNNEEGTIEV